MKLTSKDQKIFSFIRDYINSHGKSPTLQEIKRNFNYKSLTSVQRSVKSLQAKGLIKKNKNYHRSISVTANITQTVNIPLVGNVACGSPLLATENIEGYIPTDTSFIRGNAKDYFYLKAQGDSMDKAGIADGDLILIHSQNQANEGDTTVALLDDSATIKTLKKREGYVILEPKSYNVSHHPIILKEDFLIQGVVTKVIKS